MLAVLLGAAGNAHASDPVNNGEISVAGWKSDRPDTVDVDNLKLTWSLTTKAGEPYLTYGIKWKPGAQARTIDDRKVGIRSERDRRQVKLARGAVLRAKVDAPDCDGCAWIEFIVPKTLSWPADDAEFAPVSPPWGALFQTSGGRHLDAQAAQRLATGRIRLADLQFEEPIFDLGAVGGAAVRRTAKPQSARDDQPKSQKPDCFIPEYCQ
ncbi:MAG: hypothetical protein GC201_15780 [Alphaproteobacteria bacterium]|nr:hypothetical protein [Alphaproteobacteria bacterium]